MAICVLLTFLAAIDVGMTDKLHKNLLIFQVRLMGNRGTPEGFPCC
jgi:hypothetical protein